MKRIKHIRQSIIQTYHSKDYKGYLNKIGTNISKFLKKDNNNIIIKEKENEKFNEIYDSKKVDKIDDEILFFALITFHQKKGGVVECTFPPKEEIISKRKLDKLIDKNDKNFSKYDLILDKIYNYLINYCLIDGIHLQENNSNFFIINDFPKVIFCYFYYKQINTTSHSTKDDFQENIRGSIQKSFCILSLVPIFTNTTIYENYYTHINKQMNLYMIQYDLNIKKYLINIYEKLSNDFSTEKQFTFNKKKAFFLLKNDLLIILKLLILEKKIIILSKNPSNASLLVMTLLSFLPGYFTNGRSGFDEQNGTPLQIFNENYLIYPLFSLYDMEPFLQKLKDNKTLSYLLGITNEIILRNNELKYNCLINVDENKVIYKDLNANIQRLNGRETKLVEIINDFITKFNSLDKPGKININEIKDKECKEPWIIKYENKKDFKDINYYIKKLVLSYYMNLFYDTSYLIKEMKNMLKSIDEDFIKIQRYILEKYLIKSVLLEKSQSLKNNDLKKEPTTLENLPLAEEILSDPILYNLYFVLPLNYDSLYPNSGISKTGNDKQRLSILNKLSNLALLYEWTETYNFSKWIYSFNEKMSYLSTLNSKESKITLYDYDNNIYEGSMLLGKKEGKGKITFNEKDLIFIGNYKKGKREGPGELTSKDGNWNYKGVWVDNKVEGEGISYISNEMKLMSQFSDNIFDGNSLFIEYEKLKNKEKNNFDKEEKINNINNIRKDDNINDKEKEEKINSIDNIPKNNIVKDIEKEKKISNISNIGNISQNNIINKEKENKLNNINQKIKRPIIIPKEKDNIFHNLNENNQKNNIINNEKESKFSNINENIPNKNIFETDIKIIKKNINEDIKIDTSESKIGQIIKNINKNIKNKNNVGNIENNSNDNNGKKPINKKKETEYTMSDAMKNNVRDKMKKFMEKNFPEDNSKSNTNSNEINSKRNQSK
jgi:hypothetical protein